MPRQDTSPKALRDQLRAQRAHPSLRAALVVAYAVALVTGFIRIVELAPDDPLLRALLGAAATLSGTTLLLFGAMLVDLIDALLRLHITPQTSLDASAAPAPLRDTLAKLRATSAYGPLRKLLLLCYLCGALASVPLAVSTLFSVVAGGLVVYLGASAVIDLADALLRAQSHLAPPPADA